MNIVQTLLFTTAAVSLVASVSPAHAAIRQPGGLPAFVLTYWCGPPPAFASDSRFDQVKKAGFNVAMPPCEGGGTVAENRKMLAAAHHAGLKMFVSDSRMPLRITGEKDAESRIDAIVADYHADPGLAGYFITDEPQATAFEGLGEVVAALRQRDPAHPAYINLFPNYASAGQLAAPSYAEYLRRFVAEVHPAFLSYDHYHFHNGDDGPLFFANLAAVRTEAAAAGIPFWNIVLLVQHGPYRNLTEAEIRWESFQSLAYGARGVVYFTYWTPPADSMNFRHGAISVTGAIDPHYGMVAAANRESQIFGALLANLTSEQVYHTGTPPEGALAIPSDAPLVPEGPDYTVGDFRDRRGARFVFLVNGNYREGRQAVVRTGDGVGSVQQYDSDRGRWQRIRLSADSSFVLSLPAGGGALFRLGK